MTLGEGGAVNIVRNAALIREAESFRDWGRDCWCASGNTTPAANGSNGSLANCRADTTTNTSTVISDTV